MKTAFKNLFILTTAVLSVSCRKEEVTIEKESNTIDMHILAGQTGTKTVIRQEDGKYIPYWTVGDKICLMEFIYSKFEKNSEDWTGPEDWPANSYDSDGIAEESKVADFTVHLDKRTIYGEQFHYMAVYPSSSFRSYQWTGDEYYLSEWRERWSSMVPESIDLTVIPPHPTAIVEIPIDQKPVPGYFDPNADVLVSDILDSDTQPEHVSMTFGRVGSILKMNLTGLPSSFQPLHGELKCDPSWPAAYLMEYDSHLKMVGIYSKPSNWIRFDLSEYPVCSKEPMTVWLRTISGSIKDWFTVSVYGMVGKEECVFQKDVKLKTALNIPEGELTEIDVLLQQGYEVGAYLGEQSVEETSIGANVYFNLHGPDYSSVEFGVYFTEGVYYEDHSTSWKKQILHPDTDLKASLTLDSLKPDTNYTIAPFVLIDGAMYWTGNYIIHTLKHYDYTQPDAVDMGLSVKWASFNLGATKPSEAGYHFSWAETYPRTSSPGYDYKWPSPSKYTIDSGNGTIDSADDPAAVNLGGEWRLPTKDEWYDLKMNCEWNEETLDGVTGIRATSTKNGQSLFFPYAGYAKNNYDNPKEVGYKAGLMTGNYTSGDNCWEVTLPWSYDFYTHKMSSTLVSVRAVK